MSLSLAVRVLVLLGLVGAYSGESPRGQPLLEELFDGPVSPGGNSEGSLSPNLAWQDEPTTWSVREGKLEVTMDPETDYWQKTYYVPDVSKTRGPFLGMSLGPGDVVMETCFTVRPQNLFDQAGLLLLASPECWVKAGIEFSDGVPRLSVVFTSGASTWATQPWPLDDVEESDPSESGWSTSVAVRLYRIGEDVVAEARYDPPGHRGNNCHDGIDGGNSGGGKWLHYGIGRVEGIARGARGGVTALAPTSKDGWEHAGSASFDYLQVWRCPAVGRCFAHSAKPDDGDNGGGGGSGSGSGSGGGDGAVLDLGGAPEGDEL